MKSIVIVLVIVCTMIDMNYAGVSECFASVESIFSQSPVCMEDNIEMRIKYIMKHTQYDELKEQPYAQAYIRHLYKAVSKRESTMLLLNLEKMSDASDFCQQYNSKSRTKVKTKLMDHCLATLKSYNIEKTDTMKMLINRVYFNLITVTGRPLLELPKDESGNEQEDPKIDYINDLVKKVQNIVKIRRKKLFGIEGTKNFCGMTECVDNIQQNFSNCETFTGAADYIQYTISNIVYKKLDSDDTKAFVDHLYNGISVKGKVELPNTFCYNLFLNRYDLTPEEQKCLVDGELNVNDINSTHCEEDLKLKNITSNKTLEIIKHVYYELDETMIKATTKPEDSKLEYTILYIHRIKTSIQVSDKRLKLIKTPQDYCVKKVLS